MNNLLNVSASPHVRDNVSTKTIMRDVAIAMLPTSIYGVYNFGMNALLLLVACVATCVLSEYIWQKAMKKPITVGDYSAVVTGMILALNLPATLPLWIAILGSVFAIIVVKQLYGGLGQNFMNPALAARCFLMISFTARMTNFPVKDTGVIVEVADAAAGATAAATGTGAAAVDAFAGATPLHALKYGASVDLMEAFIGNISGTIGETSKLCLLIGAAYLLYKKIISPRIPVVYIGTVVIFVAIFGGYGLDVEFIMSHVLTGGLIFGAFFMATDYVTTPITPKGQILFAVIIGLLTGIFRIFGPSAEGVSYAIIIGNLLVPLIEKVTIPTPFGLEKKGGKA